MAQLLAASTCLQEAGHAALASLHMPAHGLKDLGSLGAKPSYLMLDLMKS